jgi:uncharacterized SAM-binding protein YcdF (DUF218 family)
MFMTLKAVLHTLFLPPGALLLLAFAGAALIARSTSLRARRTGWSLLLAGLTLLWLLATPLVADALTRAAERCPPLDLTRPPAAQAIVILGGGAGRLDAPEYGHQPAVALTLLERVNYGAFIARRTGLPILVSGTPVEAAAMRVALARDFQAPTRWLENRSRDTFENARFTARMLQPAGITRIVLVTDAVHEWRALQEFTSAGFSVVPAPVGVTAPHPPGFLPSTTALTRSRAALYEMLGNAVRVLLASLHLRRQQPSV